MSSPPLPGPDEHDTGLRLEALDPDRPPVVLTPWGTMALYRRGDEVLCSQAFCPHLAGPLFEGARIGDSITCPWHQWSYDLRSGERLDSGRPRQGPGAEALVCCRVRLSPTGTIVLRRP